ncbi:MAG: glycosyltransferase N-terminal domain-containing protein [Planctomycetota bacterium]
MKWLFNIIYLTVLVLLIPWLVWRVTVQKKNRRGWSNKLWGKVPKFNDDNKRIWIHAVSVGEINLLSPLIDELKRQRPEYQVVVSTTTESGFDLAKRKFPELKVFFCPFDFSWAVERAFRRINPELFLLTELELWPNLISAAKKQGAAVVLFNGRIGKKSYKGYRQFRRLLRPIFDQIDLAMVQTESYRQRLIKLGLPIDKVYTTGNIKFDCTASYEDYRGPEFFELASCHEQQVIFLAGSTQLNEDKILIKAYKEAKVTIPNLRMIMAPRHPERCAKLVSVLKKNRLPHVLRSELKPGMIDTGNPPILIIDVIGELRAWWSIANIGYVGGSMGRRGGQNMIEPALLGVPACFGPNTRNFKNVVNLLIRNKAARVVHNVDDLVAFLRFGSDNTMEFKAMGIRAQEIANSQQGAAQRSVDIMESAIMDPRNKGNLPAKMAA